MGVWSGGGGGREGEGRRGIKGSGKELTDRRGKGKRIGEGEKGEGGWNK